MHNRQVDGIGPLDSGIAMHNFPKPPGYPLGDTGILLARRALDLLHFFVAKKHVRSLTRTCRIDDSY